MRRTPLPLRGPRARFLAASPCLARHQSGEGVYGCHFDAPPFGALMSSLKLSLILATACFLAVLAVSVFIVVFTGSTAGLEDLAAVVRALGSLHLPS